MKILNIDGFLDVAKIDIESDYIEKEESEIINKVLDSLSEIEQEFIDLRYGFTGETHNLYEIEKYFEKRNITMTIEELEIMQYSILDKLRSRNYVASLALNYQG